MNIVSLLSAKNYSLGEGAVLALVGFVIVLIVLALLVGIFYLSGFIFQTKLFNRPKKDKSKPTDVVQKAVDDVAEDEEEVVAAITAAIACVLSAEACDDNPPEFVIKRIKRKK